MPFFPMHILILDDEPRSALLLKKLLEDSLPPKATIQVLDTAAEFLKTVHSTLPDLVFMDICLNGISAFDVLDKIPERSFPIVFTTASKEFAFQAFEYGVLGYLLKPIQKDDLLTLLGRVKRQFPITG